MIIKTKTFIILVFFLISLGSVVAFGVSSPPYSSTNPLLLYPGQIKEVSFNLQNCPSLSEEDCEVKDETVAVVLKEGSEIAEITSGTSYILPYGSSNTYMILKVSIPETIPLGTAYNIKLSLTPVPTDSGGNVQLGTQYNINIPVLIKDESEIPVEPKPGEQVSVIEVEKKELVPLIAIISILILILVLIVAAIIIIYFVLKKNKVQLTKK